MARRSASKNKKSKDKDREVILADSDVMAAFAKMRPANGNKLFAMKDKHGGMKLYYREINSRNQIQDNILIAVKGFVNDRIFIMLNLDFKDPSIIMVVGAYAKGMNELFDLKWNPLLYSHLQEAWNERKRERDVASGNLV
jgi:hypothetical protein